VVILKQVTKTFGDFKAVSDLSLNILKGEIYGLMGTNGSGKTTTLKLIVGLLQPDSGEIWLNGINRLEQPVEARKRLGYAPETPYLYDYLSGADYLRFVGQIRGLEGITLTREIQELFDFFDFNNDADHLIRNYSYGMKKKISMASAMISNPDFLILDEPVEGLDVFTTEKLKNRLLKVKETGKTILLASHVLPFVSEICDRVGILHRGKLVKEISPDLAPAEERAQQLGKIYEKTIGEISIRAERSES